MARIYTPSPRNHFAGKSRVDNETGTMCACDCGAECTDEMDLEQHKKTNCRNRLITCSFCNERLPSAEAMRTHLLVCGNKTDLCPKCQQFVRRAIFAYHYENNCAADPDAPTPPSSRPDGLPARRHIAQSKQPSSRHDVPSDGQENDSDGSAFNHLRSNGRIVSPIRNQRSIVECEFCHAECASNDYSTHKENCLRNPTNINNKKRPAVPLRTTLSPARSPTNDRASPNGKVQIPCEICNEPIDYSDWTAHTEMCAERDRRRIATRVRTISQEPFIEQVPCEYCEQLFPVRDLNLHQMDCTRNPENVSRARKFARRYPPARPLPTVPARRSPQHAASSPSLSRAPHSKVSSTMSPASRDIVDRITEDQNRRTTLKDGRFAHYSSIDLERTREANGLLENGAVNVILDDRQRSLPRSGSDDLAINATRPYGGGSGYDNVHLTNSHRQSGYQTLPYRPAIDSVFENERRGPRPMPPVPNDNHTRSQSPSRDLVNRNGNQRQSSSARDKRSTYMNTNSAYHHVRNEDEEPERIQNQRPRSSSTKPKKSNGLVAEPIPAHPDAPYRPHARPMSAIAQPVPAVVPGAMKGGSLIAAPHATSGGSGFPWWIIASLAALLAVVAIGAVAYAMNKKRDRRKEDENDPNNVGKGDTDDGKTSAGAEGSSTEIIPLRSIKSSTPVDEQKPTAPLSTTVRGENKKDSVTSGMGSSSSAVDKERPLDKSPLLANGPLLKDANSLSKSPGKAPNQAIPIHVTRFGKSDTDGKLSNASKSTQPTASSVSSSRKPNESSMDESSLNASKPQSAANLSRKGSNDPNSRNRTDRSTDPSDQRGKLGTRQPIPLIITRESSLSSSLERMNDPNTGRAKQLDTSEKRGIGKSPLISSVPSGSRPSSGQNGKKKTKDPNAPTKEESTVSQRERERSLSSSTEPISRMRTARTSPEKTRSQNDADPIENRGALKRLDVVASDGREKKKSGNNSDESSASSNRMGHTDDSKAMSLMPNVPQCKTNSSSDDDDYDELLAVRAKQQVSTKQRKKTGPNSNFDSNFNVNASLLRAKKLFRTQKRMKTLSKGHQHEQQDNM